MHAKKRILIKYGGNAMTECSLQEEIFRNIHQLIAHNYEVVLVHGGGPFIQQTLNEAGIQSEFIGGHRVTSSEALKYVEMALKGRVNGDLVRIANKMGLAAVGLSGKDGQSVVAKKRWHTRVIEGQEQKMDLGMVGDVSKVNTRLTEILLENQFLPVFTCLASDENGLDYNINADMFAGHLAGALNAFEFIVLTDVDGLMKDISQPDSLIEEISFKNLPELFHTVIKGGMIPKVEACQIAVQRGAKCARILNGTQPEQLKAALIDKQSTGTTIFN